MKARFALLFPYICLGLVVGFIWWRGVRDESPDAAGVARVDPVCRMEVGSSIRTEWRGESYYFCTDICRVRFT